MAEQIGNFGMGRSFAAACDLYPRNLPVEQKREKADNLKLLLIDIGESTTLEFEGGQAKVNCLPYDGEGKRGYLKIEVNIAGLSTESRSVSMILPPDSGARARFGEVVADPMYIGRRPKIVDSSITFVDAGK